MLLYIVRHAYAGQRGDPRYPDDGLRPLTRKGRKRFSRAIKEISSRGFAPSLVATSPLVRCVQTADVIHRRVKPSPKVHELEALQPGSRLDELLNWSNDQQLEQLAWVGHAPDVDELATALVGGKGATIAFAKGAVAAIEFESDLARGKGTLRWLVTPKLLGY